MNEFLVYVEYRCPKGFQITGWRVCFPLHGQSPRVGKIWGRNPPLGYPCRLFDEDVYNYACERRILDPPFVPAECRGIAKVLEAEPFDVMRLDKLGLADLGGPLGEYIDQNKILVTLKTNALCFSQPSDLVTFSDGCQINSGAYSWVEIAKEKFKKRLSNKGEIVKSENCAYSCRLSSLCERCPSPGKVNWYLEDVEVWTLRRAYEVGLTNFNLKFDWGLAAYESGEGR